MAEHATKVEESFVRSDSLKPKTCPGVPAGPPPRLDDYDDEESAAAAAREETRRSKKIRFDDERKDNLAEAGDDEDVVAPGEESGPQVDEIQRKMLLMAGQDVDQYMKEVSTAAAVDKITTL